MSWGSIGHFLWLQWVLPFGSVWSNLVASVVTGAIVMISHFKHSRHVEDLFNPETPGGITDVMDKLNGDRNATLRGQGRPEDSL